MDRLVDYYDLLGVDRLASRTEIEQAVRATRKRYRRLEGSPDQSQRASAERMMGLLAEAEKTLLNADAREAYNMALEKMNQQAEEERRHAESSEEHDWVLDASRYLDEKNPSSALFAATEGTRQHPENLSAWIFRALAAMHLDRYDEAEYAAREALKIDSTFEAALDILSESCLQLERYDEALTLARRLKKLNPGEVDYACRVARILFLKGDHAEALKEAREVMSAFPKSDQAAYTLRICLVQDGENTLSRQAGMSYITNERQIDHLVQVVGELQRLSSLDDDTREWIAEANKLIEHARGRHYVGAPTWYWVLAGFFVLCLLAGAGANPIPWVVFIVLLAYGLKEVWPYGWQANAKQLGSAATNSGLQ